MNRESKHFVVEYHESEKECVNEVLSLLEDKYSTIAKRKGKELKQKIIVKICSNRQELVHTLGIKDALPSLYFPCERLRMERSSRGRWY